MDKHHNHVGPWWGIGVVLVALILCAYGRLMLTTHQFDVIYDRVGTIQRELECADAGEVLVADHEGDEYCLAIPTPVK